MTYEERVGCVLCDLRRAKQISQIDTAKHLGLAQSVVSRMEQGVLPITVGRLAVWAKFLGTTASAVLLVAESDSILEKIEAAS